MPSLIPCVCRILYLYLPCRYKQSFPLVLVGYYTYIYPVETNASPHSLCLQDIILIFTLQKQMPPLIPCVCRIQYLYLPCRYKQSLPLVLVGYYTYIYHVETNASPHPLCLQDIILIFTLQKQMPPHSLCLQDTILIFTLQKQMPPLIPCFCRILHLYLPCRYKQSLPLVFVGYYTYIYLVETNASPHLLCLQDIILIFTL